MVRCVCACELPRQPCAQTNVCARYINSRMEVYLDLRLQIAAYFRKPGETTVSLSTKIMSGLAAGAIGISIATVSGCICGVVHISLLHR